MSSRRVSPSAVSRLSSSISAPTSRIRQSGRRFCAMRGCVPVSKRFSCRIRRCRRFAAASTMRSPLNFANSTGSDSWSLGSASDGRTLSRRLRRGTGIAIRARSSAARQPSGRDTCRSVAWFAEAPDVLLALRPCWMASPLSVSQLIPGEHPLFDLVVVRRGEPGPAEDAVTSLLRGRQAVIAGDSRQLPPTTFFAAGVDGRRCEKTQTRARRVSEHPRRHVRVPGTRVVAGLALSQPRRGAHRLLQSHDLQRPSGDIPRAGSDQGGDARTRAACGRSGRPGGERVARGAAGRGADSRARRHTHRREPRRHHDGHRARQPHLDGAGARAGRTPGAGRILRQSAVRAILRQEPGACAG